MKIETLSISNFRGITDVRLENLGNMVIIAGQNGSGKSCIFDAIRLLKSLYGGYQANEWQQWMGEFQISLTNRASDFALMMNDVTRELRVSCDFRLANEERAYIQSHADELLRDEISDYANRTLVSAIDTGTDPKGSDLASLLFTAIENSAARLEKARTKHLSKNALIEQAEKINAKYVEGLANGTWTSIFRGRDVLKRFAGKHAPSISYEVFRNLVLSKMKDDGYRPEGMESVVKKILTS